MTRVYPYYEIDLTEDGFVHIVHEQLLGHPPDYVHRNDLWFERQNLPWVVNAIQDCISVDRMRHVYLTRGDDRLDVREWGNEHAPDVSLGNLRAGDHAHSAIDNGVSGFSVSFPLAAKLLADLDALITWDAEAYAIANAPVPLEFAEAAKAGRASRGPGRACPSAWYVNAWLGYTLVMEGRENPANHPSPNAPVPPELEVVDTLQDSWDPRREALTPEIETFARAHLPPIARELRLVDGLCNNSCLEIHHRHGEIMVFVPRNVMEPLGSTMVSYPDGTRKLRVYVLYNESLKFDALLRFHQPFEAIRALRARLRAAEVRSALTSELSSQINALPARLTALFQHLEVAANAVEYGIYEVTSYLTRDSILATIEAPLAEVARDLPQLANEFTVLGI